MKRLLSFILACLLLIPASAFSDTSQAPDGLIPADGSFSQLLGDENALYVTLGRGNISQYLPEKQEAIASFDEEEAYPFMMNGAIHFLNRKDETITRLTPQGEEQPVRVPVTQDLAGGGDDWELRHLKTDGNALYFLYFDQNRETPLLCRYRFEDKAFDLAEIDSLSEYVLAPGGETLAVARGPEQTALYAVDWQGKPRELYRLQGSWAGFAASEGELYAADITGLSFARLKNGKEQARVRSPYAAGVTEGIITQGVYYALGAAGLYSPDFGEKQGEARVLRVLDGYADETDRAFMLAHPDVSLEYISSNSFEGMNLGTALITGVLQYDVGRLSNNEAAAESLLDKGYAMDLSAYPALLEKARAMYQPIRDFIFRDGRLMLMPQRAEVRGLLGQYNRETLEAIGLEKDDIPRTMEEFLDFITAWREKYGEPESTDDIVPIMDDNGEKANTGMDMLTFVMQAYSAHYRRKGEDLDFDTEQFRRLIGKALTAADVIPHQTYEMNHRRLFVFFGERVPSTRSFVLPLSADESPRYEGYLSGYIVDPRSPVKELALDYIAWRMEHLDDLYKLMLYEGEYAALEREDYPAHVEGLLNEKALVEEAISREESEAEKRVLQERLDKLTREIEQPKDMFRYQITQAEIDFYQQEILPNIEFPFADITTEYSYENLDTWRMMQRFVAGELDQERFVQELNQRERLRRLENQ